MPISTAGDRDARGASTRSAPAAACSRATSSGALLDGDVDAAVHSAKDLTGDMPDGLVLGAILERADPRDAVCGPYGSLEEIPAGARVGTSSARRAGLLAELRPDLERGAAARQRRHPPRQARRR